jgi:hypothetical protein
MKKIITSLLFIFLASCTENSAEIDSSIVSQDGRGGNILAICSSGVIEVGIKSEETAFSEEAFMSPLKDVDFVSTVKVINKKNGKIILKSVSQHPQIYWKGKGGGIEYVGLHEIEIKGDRECNDYLITLYFERVPEIFFTENSKVFAIYARRSMRP